MRFLVQTTNTGEYTIQLLTQALIIYVLFLEKKKNKTELNSEKFIFIVWTYYIK